MASAAGGQGWPQLVALYRRVLRVHRDKLPGPLRSLGDSYARQEWQLHLRAKTTPAQWDEFGRQWSSYVAMLQGTADLEQRSGDMPADVVGALSREQQQQLAKLQEAAVDLARGEPPGDGLDRQPLG